MNRKKSIQYLSFAMCTCIVFLFMLSLYIVQIVKKDLYAEKVQYLTEISDKSTELVRTKIKDNLDTLTTIANFIGHDPSTEVRRILPILQRERNNNGFKKMGIIFPNGQAITTDEQHFDLSDRMYFKKALAGQSNVSDPLMDHVDGFKINVFAVPIYQQEQIVAVLFATEDANYLKKTLTVKSFDGQGYSYIVKGDGTSILHTLHKNCNMECENLFDPIIQAEHKMKKNTKDVRSFTQQGVVKQFSCAEIGINDWHFIDVVPTEAISKGSDRVLVSVSMTFLLILVLICGLAYTLFYIIRKNNKTLYRMAYIDQVTGYANWQRFMINALSLCKQHVNQPYAMVIFDIDKFKIINDLYGYVRGNEILREIAEIVNKEINEYETFSRATRDHFNLLLTYINDAELIARLNRIAEQSLHLIEGYAIELSFGIYRIIEEMPDMNVCSDRANLAKLTIKGNKTKNMAFFNEEIRQIILAEKAIENQMDSALLQQEFVVYLQPKYSFATEKIVGAEALVRWNHLEKGLMPPNDFIPLFEKNGFIKRLDYYMLEQICQLLRRWKNENKVGSALLISVNLSRMHLKNTHLATELFALTQQYGVEPHLIELELTESVFFGDTKKIIEIMKKLKEVGFLISIDDFGSGYSSMNMLKDLPVDVLKLDKGFLEKSKDDAKGRIIIASLIRMAKALHLSVVAEGVETKDQVVFLKQIGCDIAQGYFYAKPMSIKNFEQLLVSQSHKKTEDL